jgi:hypothetical protein
MHFAKPKICITILTDKFTIVLIQNKYRHELYGVVRQGAHLNLVCMIFLQLCQLKSVNSKVMYILSREFTGSLELRFILLLPLD